ncbi:hypothetical protein [Streptomyces lydicus]|uniref:hypothetical protein n=1 Tax=Streptomyces lydicus TaxID=47763 RepID=UPI00341F4850
MPIGMIPAAKYIARKLPDPFEGLLGGEASHNLLNRAHAHWCTGPGHSISWDDCYAAADKLPIPQKARLFLDAAGRPLAPPSHLKGEQLAEVEEAIVLAAWADREAHRHNIAH